MYSPDSPRKLKKEEILLSTLLLALFIEVSTLAVNTSTVLPAISPKRPPPADSIALFLILSLVWLIFLLILFFLN